LAMSAGGRPAWGGIGRRPNVSPRGCCRKGGTSNKGPVLGSPSSIPFSVDGRSRVFFGQTAAQGRPRLKKAGPVDRPRGRALRRRPGRAMSWRISQTHVSATRRCTHGGNHLGTAAKEQADFKAGPAGECWRAKWDRLSKSGPPSRSGPAQDDSSIRARPLR